jgi:hypothetical protein
MTGHEPDGRTGPDQRSGGPVDHDRIDELLAAHALHALDGDDLREAERLLAEHLPECDRCRETVEGFRGITAELALGSRPASPPEMLLPRLRRETLALPVDVEQQAPSKPRRAVGSWLSAAAALTLVGLVLWNAFLHVRLGDVRDRQGRIAQVTHFMAQPDAQTVALESLRPSTRVLLGYREAEVALFGTDVTPPARGHVYRVWVGRGDRDFVHMRDFVPDEGLVALLLRFDLRRFDQILITEEREGVHAMAPNGAPRWTATLHAEPAGAGADVEA